MQIVARIKSLLPFLYGENGKRNDAHSKRASIGFKLPLFLSLLPLFLGTICLLCIAVIVDPYNVRPWGLPTKLADHRYPDTEWPMLIRSVTAQSHDIVIVGGSSVMGISNEQMKEAFGQAARPINLAYPYAMPTDTKETLQIVFKTPDLKKLLLFVDHSQMMPMETKFLPAKMRDNLDATNWAHAGDFNLDTALASFHRIANGRYDLEEWQSLQRPQFVTDITLENDNKAVVRLNKAFAKYRKSVLGGAIKPDCTHYPFIDQVLEPALRQVERQNITVDVIFPPYPYISYYDWIDRRFQSDPFPRGPVFRSILSFKKCVTAAVDKAGLPMRTIAMDNDLFLGSNLALYMDSLHISKPAGFDRVMRNVKSDEYILTPQNFGRYQAELERNILSVKRP